jgi:hypothetical protein
MLLSPSSMTASSISSTLCGATAAALAAAAAAAVLLLAPSLMCDRRAAARTNSQKVRSLSSWPGLKFLFARVQTWHQGARTLSALALGTYYMALITSERLVVPTVTAVHTTGYVITGRHNIIRTLNFAVDTVLCR